MAKFEHPLTSRRAFTPLLLLSAWCLMLVMHGAVPFLLTPTLGQAIWSTGFSQSFVNQSLWTVYATNFGAPEPAAMAFGLPGAWLTALYIQLGLQPPDAYSAMVASWMTLAMGSAYAMARHFSAKPALAVLAALGWMSMPATWAHAGYSMLSIGIALLPLYFLCSLKLLQQCAPADGDPVGNHFWWKLTYPLVCILAVFMDGYSFMFFAVGAGLLGGWWWLKTDSIGRRRLALVALPLHVLSLLAGYLLYSTFVGKSSYSAASLDFFRGWGADLTFFARPTLGMHWLPDVLGWSVARSDQQYFGDASVWITTFCIPVTVGGIWAAWRMARVQRAALGLLLVAGFGFYMAMGPSIKLNSVKPEGATLGPLMPAEAALAPTGSGFLSEKLPGFNGMRASYRWTALGVFGAWGVLLLALSTRNQRDTQLFAASLMAGVILLNLPDLPKKWAEDVQNRAMFFQIETDLVDDMRLVLNAKERVAFLPWRNDFLVNYLASRLNVVSFNIGGDKNLESARVRWPTWMRGFQYGQIDAQFANRIVMLLTSKQADAVVLPYSDMLWAAHRWPYLQEFRDQMLSIAQTLEHLDMFEITAREHYIVVRLNPEYRNAPSSTNTSKLQKHACLSPLCLKQEGFNQTVQTQSGTLSGKRLVTRGQQGFLLYGPNVEMNPGEYILTVYGSSSVHTGTWIDVASNQGKTQHGRYALMPHGEHLLLEARVTLPAAVQDLEVRVFAGPQDQVQLDGYKLQPVTPTSSSGPP
ncbi:hypothetical protein KIH07_21005 [Hydrogenophaga taeniospiralis]|uniref:hypothetical protein n=1 Tax=Hydrogenophaga taeniospiralis TaxID=65656 RepID=UPI001CF99D7A|nr:hypothetical protein [Hydrogenophaga taeniospiralis]MCB4366222.1 hypothetical protein [Hydrogenophaga taeniospiralis]